MIGDGGNNNFLIGNLIMGVALVMLLFIGTLWEMMGAAAVGLWIAVAGAGLYFLMKE